MYMALRARGCWISGQSGRSKSIARILGAGSGSLLLPDGSGPSSSSVQRQPPASSGRPPGFRVFYMI